MAKKRLSAKIQRGRIPLVHARATNRRNSGRGRRRPRGGTRSRAGRPRTINWKAVQKLAVRNNSEEDIIASLEIPMELLKDQATSERLRETVSLGRARYRVKLRDTIYRRGVEGRSVNILLGAARNDGPDWDQPAAQITEQLPEVNEAQLLGLLNQLGAGGGPYGAPDQATA